MDVNEIDILEFMRSNHIELDENDFNNVIYKGDEMYEINDDDFNMNNENIVPNFDMENYQLDDQIMSSYDISNKGELVQTLNETCYYNSQLGENFIQTNTIQPFIKNGVVLNTELKPFKSPSYHIIKPIISEIEQYTKEKFEYLEEIRQTHLNLVRNLLDTNDDKAIEDVNKLFMEYSQILTTNNRAISELNNLRVTTIMEPHEIDRTLLLVDNLEILNIYIRLYASEIQTHLQKLTPQIGDLIAFVIKDSPFPGLWLKKNQLSSQEALCVQIITSPFVEIYSTSEVKCHILCHSGSNSKKAIVDNDTLTLDSSTKSCRYQPLFLSGTRKDVAQFRFTTSVQTNINDRIIEISTPLSRPFLVITNECQYADSSGILFMKDCFEHRWGKPMSEIPWPFFANSVQHYFLKATRQDLQKPIRGLSKRDLNYFHQVFFNSSMSIDRKSFQLFWDWFGKVIHKLRYQRHMSSLWVKGLVYGMLSRDGVWRFLQNQPVGTFVIRFSESNAGSIAIGYKAFDGSIKNYLMKQEDYTGNAKSIPDFIRTRPEFLYVLQYVGDDMFDIPQLSPVLKDNAFITFYSHKPKSVQQTQGNPYDEF